MVTAFLLSAPYLGIDGTVKIVYNNCIQKRTILRLQSNCTQMFSERKANIIMDQLTIRAMAKINLGLDVTRRREDGYHEVRMIMQTVNLFDELSFRKIPEDEFRLSTNLGFLPTDKNNLIVKAASILKEEFGIREGLSIRLKKNIPVAAGMAGGSVDAAAAFHAVNEMFDLGLSVEELQKRAVKVGADVPYCIQGGTALSEGIGEILTPLPAAPECTVLVAKPPIHVSTKFVYQNLHLDRLDHHPDIDGILKSIENGDIRGVAQRLENVLESVTVREFPVIEQIKQKMKDYGALGSLMSGSGPTVFGLYENRETARKAYDALKKSRLAKDVILTSFIDQACVRI